MPVFESRDLSDADAKKTVKHAKEVDDPPPSDAQIIKQPNGLFTVILTYPDAPPDANGNQGAGN